MRKQAQNTQHNSQKVFGLSFIKAHTYFFIFTLCQEQRKSSSTLIRVRRKLFHFLHSLEAKSSYILLYWSAIKERLKTNSKVLTTRLTNQRFKISVLNFWSNQSNRGISRKIERTLKSQLKFFKAFLRLTSLFSIKQSQARNWRTQMSQVSLLQVQAMILTLKKNNRKEQGFWRIDTVKGIHSDNGRWSRSGDKVFWPDTCERIRLDTVGHSSQDDARFLQWRNLAHAKGSFLQTKGSGKKQRKKILIFKHGNK